MKKLFLLCSLLITFVLAGCSEKEDNDQLYAVRVQVTLPESYANLPASDLKVMVSNLSTAKKAEQVTDATGVATFSLEAGIYHIEVSGGKTIQNEAGEDKVLFFRANALNKSVSAGKTDFTLDAELSPVGNQWVIKEIYFTGSKTVTGGSYWNDQYIEVYNNSSEILYADGLTISESEHTSINDLNTWGAFLPGRVAAGTIYSVPGNGADYPVQPGASLVLASNGSNHKVLNPNSPVDLSNASFEWYDDHALDVDVPEVPNLIKHYSYSLSVWIMHNRGYRSYFIFKPDTDMTSFLETNKVEGIMPSGKISYAYVIPASVIYDGVELSLKNGLVNKALPASVDAGYSYCDAAGTGLVVRRKVQKNENGRYILQDTNNSSDDFLPNQIPSPFIVK